MIGTRAYIQEGMVESAPSLTTIHILLSCLAMQTTHPRFPRQLCPGMRSSCQWYLRSVFQTWPLRTCAPPFSFPSPWLDLPKDKALGKGGAVFSKEPLTEMLSVIFLGINNSQLSLCGAGQAHNRASLNVVAPLPPISKKLSSMMWEQLCISISLSKLENCIVCGLGTVVVLNELNKPYCTV